MAPHTKRLIKHPVATQLANYLFLLPFLLGFRALMHNSRQIDLVVYAAGIIIVLILIVYGNRKPLVQIESKQLLLHLSYKHQAERHPFNEISAYKRLSQNRIRIFSEQHQPVNLRLGKKDTIHLIAILKNEGINERQ